MATLMKLPTSSIGMLLLAIFLILYGLTSIIKLNFEGMQYVMGGLAIAAGVCLIINK